MAVFAATTKYGDPVIDMQNLPYFIGSTAFANNLITVSAWQQLQQYYGSFALAPSGEVTGLLTSIYYSSESWNGQNYSLTGIAFDAKTAINYINNRQLNELAAQLLSGNDIISGTNPNYGFTAYRGDNLIGYGGNDQFFPNGGSDTIDGGTGVDTVSMPFTFADAKIAKTLNGYNVTIVDQRYPSLNITKAAYSLSNVERLVFQDKAIAMDVSGNAGQAYRLYQAAFDRKPDAGGLGTWIGLMDKGMSLAEVSSYFQRSEEFKTLYGTSVTNEKLVDLLYQNVLDRLPDANGYATWKGVLDAGTWTREQVLIGFSESTENQVKVIGSIQNGIEYQPTV